jgi:DNA-binding MarR family transcriptional regulator
MSSAPTFGTQVIGQTEKALNAILDRQLDGTGLTEPQWVSLTIAVMTSGTLERVALVSRVGGALKLGDAEAAARLNELADAGLLGLTEGDHSPVSVTDEGRRLHGQVRTAVAEITHRLWGDLPAEDLATAGRVLRTVLDRATAELSG